MSLRDHVAMTPPDAPRRNRLAGWLAPIMVVMAVLVWNAAAWGIDLSPLEQPDTSWGFAFATTVYSVAIGVPLLCVTLFSAGVAHAWPGRARLALTTGAGACAVAAIALAVLMVLVVATEGLPLASDVVFLVATVLVAGTLTVPLVSLRSTLAACAGR